MAASKKILIADDSPTDRRIFAAAVESLGYSAVCVSNGERALQVVDENPDVAMVITDHEMEKMSGDELIRALRADARFSKLPIIVISGVIKLSEVSSILAAGASRFLAKPVNISELSEYIKFLVA